MPDKIEIKGVINKFESKIGAAGSRFCELKIKIPTTPENAQMLVGLQGKSLSMTLKPIQEELFTGEE